MSSNNSLKEFTLLVLLSLLSQQLNAEESTAKPKMPLAKMQVSGKPILVHEKLTVSEDVDSKRVYQLSFDIGEVPYNEVTFVCFNLMNPTGQRLVVGDVHLSCSCSSLGLKTEQVPHGEVLEGMLRLKPMLRRTVGTFRHEVQLQLATDNQASAILVFKGLVRKPLQATAQSPFGKDGALWHVANVRLAHKIDDPSKQLPQVIVETDSLTAATMIRPGSTPEQREIWIDTAKVDKTRFGLILAAQFGDDPRDRHRETLLIDITERVQRSTISVFPRHFLKNKQRQVFKFIHIGSARDQTEKDVEFRLRSTKQFVTASEVKTLSPVMQQIVFSIPNGFSTDEKHLHFEAVQGEKIMAKIKLSVQ